MTGFNHGLTGAVIALTVKRPELAIPLAFLSHFVQDIVPHWNYGVSRDKDRSGRFFTKSFTRILEADFLLSIALMIVLGFVFPAHKWLIWTCMITAASPDLMWAYYRLYQEHIHKRRPKYDPLARLHILVQWSQTTPGFAVELLWIAGGIIILMSLK